MAVRRPSPEQPREAADFLGGYRHPTWKPGDPCPHCGAKGQIKGVREPFCLACRKYVDAR